MFVISGIMILGLILYFRPFSSTEIIILDHLTEINDDGVVNQICLVKSPPYFSSSLEHKIEEFDKKKSSKRQILSKIVYQGT